MAFLSELSGFVLYALQQAGILLGVGAEMVLLVSYLLHVHAGASGPSRYTASARAVERMGLGLIIASGFGVVFYHVLLWQPEVLASAAFIAKWTLIAIVLVGYKIERWAEANETPWRSMVHGFIGGTWLGLFLLHMLAPDTSVFNLLIGYALWMVFFTVVWSGFVTALSPSALVQFFAPKPKQARPAIVPRETPVEAPVEAPVVVVPPVVVAAPAPIVIAEAPKPSVMPAVAPVPPAAPVPAVPVVYKVELVAPAPAPKHVEPAPAPRKPAIVIVVAAPAPHPVKAAPAPAPEPGLPRIWVMPRSPGQLPA